MIYVLVFLLIAVAAVLVGRDRERRWKATGMNAFKIVYAGLSPLPELTMRRGYGYPNFRVTFASRDALQAGLDKNAQFTSEIERLFRRFGTIKRPFLAKKAIWFGYKGEFDERIAAIKRRDEIRA
jgi:hypothetical protein